MKFNELIKSKKFIIIGAVLLLVIILGCIFFSFFKKDISTEKPNSNPKIEIKSYSAYVSINPLIKLSFEQKCYKKNEEYTCEEPVVKNYVLENDDAKKIYSDIDFTETGGILSDVLVKIAQTARENEIVFDHVSITSDWQNFEEYKDTNEELSKWNFIINIVQTEDMNEIPQENHGCSLKCDNGYTLDEPNCECIKNQTDPETNTPEQIKYDFNLNDNIFYTFYDINIIKKPSETCATNLMDAGYIFSKNGNNVNDYENAKILYYTLNESDELFKDNDFNIFKSCVEPMTQSDINFISNLKGAKYDGKGEYTGLEQEKLFFAIVFDEDIYNEKLVFTPYNPPKGYLQFESTGPWIEHYLLDENACKEYHLSCSRW